MRNFMPLAVLALLAALPAAAQRGGPMGPLGPMGPGGGTRGFGPGFHNHKLVTGAPYSATVTNAIVEQLQGGNTIQRTTTGQVARDSQGRTYEQQTITGGPLAQNGPTTLTFISDPVAGYSYVLDANKKTAFRHPLKAREAGSRPAGVHPEGGPAGGPPEGMRDGASVSESDLPADSSTGVTAQGKQITRTIAAGAIGNTDAIVSTSQVWTSPDLQIVVKAVRNDPRFGQSTYSLSNIVAKEPDASLFKVPAGYTVTDAPAHGHSGPGGPPPPAE